MGHYTTFFLKARLKESPEGKAALQLLKDVLAFTKDPKNFCGTGVTPNPWKKTHAFWNTERWDWILSGHTSTTGGNSTNYEALAAQHRLPGEPTRAVETEAFPNCTIIGRTITIVTSVKNYQNEIALFLQWIRPVLDLEPNEVFAWSSPDGSNDSFPLNYYSENGHFTLQPLVFNEWADMNAGVQYSSETLEATCQPPKSKHGYGYTVSEEIEQGPWTIQLHEKLLKNKVELTLTKKGTELILEILKEIPTLRAQLLQEIIFSAKAHEPSEPTKIGSVPTLPDPAPTS